MTDKPTNRTKKKDLIMGWGRMFLLRNVGQQLDIGELSESIADMQSAFLENQQVDLTQARRITDLQHDNRELKLYLATLIRLLVAKGVLQPEEVAATVNAIEPRVAKGRNETDSLDG